jgi:Phage stabilisation protein
MSTVRLPLAFPIQSRKADPFKDSKKVNAYKEGNEVLKRPGLTALPITPALPISSGQGVFAYDNALYAVINNTLYQIGVGSGSGTSTLIGSLTGATYPISWTSTFNNNFLFFHNQQYGYNYSSTGGLVQVTSDQVIEADILVPGSGYTSTPAVVFGTQWQASTTYALGDQIFYGTNLYTVTQAGTTDVTAPTFTSGTQIDGTAKLTYAGTPATGTATYDSVTGTIISIVITNRGSGYTVAPIVTIDPPTSGTQATALAVLNFFPTDLVPGVGYLDTYVAVMTKSGRIYTCMSADSTSWNPLSYISSNSQPDLATGITSHLNYIIAFNQWSTQVFYDAGNATGSPLALNPSANMEIGCVNGNSIAKFEQTVAWVGQSNTAGKGVYLIDGLSPVKISNEYIDKYLDADGVTNCTAYGMKLNGHSWYVLTLPDSNITLVYDIAEKDWSFWSTVYQNQEQYFVADFATSLRGLTYTQDSLDGEIYFFDTNTYTDADGPINFRLVSPLLDADTKDRKFIPRVEIVGDMVESILRIRHTDNDYQNWSMYRNVDLSDSRPVLYQNGITRRRAYELFSTDDSFIRLAAMEIEIVVGDS